MKEKFVKILEEDEEVIWSNKVNVASNVLVKTSKAILFGLFFSAFFGIFLSTSLTIFDFSNDDVGFEQIPLRAIIIGLTLFLVFIIVFLFKTIKDAKNTYFCITDKRIIKRSGTFADKYIHYTLKNVSTVTVIGSLFDSKKTKNESATLCVKTNHTHVSQGSDRSYPTNISVISLKNAYDAYNILSKLVKGNNENIRIEMVEKIKENK